MDQSVDSLATLASLAFHLLAQVEALETLLIQKELATKQEILAAIAQAERGLSGFARGVVPQGEKDFGPALEGTLKLLRQRLADRLK